MVNIREISQIFNKLLILLQIVGFRCLKSPKAFKSEKFLFNASYNFIILVEI